MSTPAGQRVQSPLNLILPLKSWLQFKETSAVINFKVVEIMAARDAIGTSHFARFVKLHDQNYLGYFTAFDGDLRNYFSELINYMGPIFNSLFQRVVDGPPLPCERNRDAFIDWSMAHNLEGIGFYSACPSLTVKEIRARAGIDFGGVDPSGQSPLTLILPVKSPNHFLALSQSLTRFLPQLYSALEMIGTVYFLRFVPLGTHAMVLVAEHDLPPEKLAQDFATHLGPMFDEIFKNVIDGPPTPVQGNTRAFSDWIVAHNLETWGFYSSYPTFTVHEIRALATKQDS